MSALASRNVLVVEDEWLVRMELVHALEDAGCIVLESASGEHAIQTLRGHPEIALMITDIRLIGEMSGWDLAVAARALDPAIAVIYVSANPVVPERNVSGSIFIDKPALTAEVIAASEGLLG